MSIIQQTKCFGNTIRPGEPGPVLPNNVIFDEGEFNMTRMKEGFSLDNVVTLQDAYRTYASRELPYSTGESIFITNFKMLIDYGGATDGTILVNTGTNNSRLVIENKRLKYVGTSDSNVNIDGFDCCLPVNFGTLVQEEYTRLYITLEYSTQGIVDPTSGERILKMCPLSRVETHAQISGSSMLDSQTPKLQLNDSSVFTEHTFYVEVVSKLSRAPAWIQLIMTHGTYLIKKMWFE